MNRRSPGVIVGHLPPMFSPIIFIHAIHALIRLTFRCNFSISKESVFSRGNFNFLKRHSWLDNWIDSPLIRSPFVYFCQIKGEIVTWKMRRLMGSHFWILLCVMRFGHHRIFESIFQLSLFYFWGSVSKSTPRVFMVKNLDDASKKFWNNECRHIWYSLTRVCIIASNFFCRLISSVSDAGSSNPSGQHLLSLVKKTTWSSRIQWPD